MILRKIVRHHFPVQPHDRMHIAGSATVFGDTFGQYVPVVVSENQILPFEDVERSPVTVFETEPDFGRLRHNLQSTFI
ncbi:MAG TPA: hypothetical protein PLG59_20095, partial [bacterium]|nr:hypothetical protein [bacterium]